MLCSAFKVYKRLKTNYLKLKFLIFCLLYWSFYLGLSISKGGRTVCLGWYRGKRSIWRWFMDCLGWNILRTKTGLKFVTGPCLGALTAEYHTVTSSCLFQGESMGFGFGRNWKHDRSLVSAEKQVSVRR